MPLLNHLSRPILVALAAALTLAGCGGGGDAASASTSVVTPAAAEPALRTIQSVGVAGADATPMLTVRAYADLAANVGAMVSVRVDGVVTDSVEVKATQPTNYRLAAPNLKPGSKVDVVYTNDATVNGVDRNLYVQQISTPDTAVLSTAAIVSFDQGSGDAAFDGQNVVAGTSNLSSNGALRLTWPIPNLTETLTVRAYSALANGVGGMMGVMVDGVQVAQFEVKSTVAQDYAVAVPPLKPGSKVDVVYSNDSEALAGGDRSLYVLQLNHKSTVVVPKPANSSIDKGLGAAAFDGVNVVPGDSGLYWNAALRVVWPEANLTSSLTVRASAQAAGGVGATMVVRVDGTVLGTSIVTSTAPADFTYPAPAYNTGSQVDIAFLNAGTVDGVARTLSVHYVRSANTVLRPTDTGVKFDAGADRAAFDWTNLSAGLTNLTANGALRATWPAANMIDAITVRASGTLADNVGPIVQIFADGILLGTSEIRSTSPTDITLPALPLKVGQIIEVRPINLATGRSLKVDYAMSGKTVLQAAAGSLNAAWPAPNLTDTLNIRARADLAGGTGAIMQVLVDNILVGTAEVNSTVNADYRFAVPPMSPGRKVDLVYINDGQVNGVDRNLYIAYLTTANTTLLPTAAGNTLDRGFGAAAFDGIDVVTGTGSMTTNGALHMNWPAANITSTVTVRASATPAGNIGALMTLWVNGVAVSAAQVNSTTPTDYLMPTTALTPGAQVAVTFANPGTVDGVIRALNVQYLIAGTTFLTPTTAGATYSAGNLSAPWPAANLTDTLTVRAYSALANGVGGMMGVMVDGVQVAQFEVKSTVAQDYAVAVPPLKPGSKVDVVYSNDSEALAGGDRSLYVLQLNHKSTAVIPKPANSSIDKGLGAAAFDGINVVQGDTGLYWNAALRVIWPEPNLTSSITVRASAQVAGSEGATMVVRMDGTVLGTSTVNSSLASDFTYPAPAYSVGSQVDVAFLNAGTVDGAARTLNVHYIKSSNTVLRPTDIGVKFDAGADRAAYDWTNLSAGLVSLTANGALRANWPAANMTDTLTVRASGTMLDNVGPVVQVFADGVLLGTFEIRSSSPTYFKLPALPLAVGQIIEVRPTNLATGRSLKVDYAMSGRTVLQAAAGSLNAAWPAPNLTDTLNIRARADLAGGTGAIMQVIVDNLLVSTVEVNSTVNSDYQIAVPPMNPGRKIDLVYINDGQVNGVDRNLYIAYLTTANTVLLPTAAGVTYDRGFGAAAFDGIDVVAGTGSMTTNGALHMNWPAANITSTVTVRASATPAGNIGALMTLWVNGVAVSAAQVNSATPTDYLMPTTALTPGAQVAVTFANPGTVDGVTRALNVQYLIAGSTFLTPTTAGATYSAGNLTAPWPAANLTDTLTVRAYASLAGNVGALMQLRVNGVIVGVQEVRSATPADHVFYVPRIQPGDKVDVQFINDAVVNGQDRNLFVQSIRGNGWTQAAFASNVSYDMGSGDAAIDGLNVSATGGAMYANGATRFAVESITPVTSTAAQQSAARLLQQASFGATPSSIDRVVQLGRAGWIDEQIQQPFSPDMVPYVESKFALGDSYRPGGANYTINWVSQKFWATAATDSNQLRRRVGFALHQILTVSQADSGLYGHVRGYAQYVDTLNRLAFGNYRDLLEEIALSPMMGIYLSHMRNRPEDVAGSRMPDENFAREVMQLFSIGLHELNADGSPVLDSQGQPVETYSNADVIALAKVFTGWSWGFPDGQLTETIFRGGTPDLKSAASDLRIDLQRMKAYPGQHSTGEKRLFASKPWAANLPAGQGAQADLSAALDALFKHPNVGPFIGRQLIQRLVTSHPSPAYIARVTATFNNNGKGVRGDLAAVVRTILMDPEAITPPAGNVGKLREPVLAMAQWLRAMDARSASGEYMINNDLTGLSQRQWHTPSVFGYFRPGYVPPNTSFANSGITVPELQLTSETTTARWVNLAMSMAGSGVGLYGSVADVGANLQPLIDMAQAGNLDGMVERLNLLLYAGRMSATLKADIVDAVTSVSGTDLPSYTNRARVALFLALAAPDYLIQR